MIGANRFLRDPPPHSLARSAYSVEVNPWSPREDVEAAIFFRGAIVSAFGNIEARLGELCIRASRIPVYDALRDRFPHPTSKRIAYLRQVFATGPLATWEATATRYLDRFQAGEELRNLVAHSQMQVLPDWGVTLRDFPSADRAGIQTRSRRLTLPEIEIVAWRAARLSRLGQHLFDLLESTGILPQYE
ncbi:MAG: hypothetical protein AB7E24_11975 [Novosphingobium sp.]